ncbi:uncharacterized protein At2g39795, mitochondrial-like [Tasmannia lanceolata]|uniref:uncharacterized protein At2g39795, mitochondrial-like n=1 Tax=Tasmannia lanceolata TaxID=3420 RepID=UPI0040636C96
MPTAISSLFGSSLLSSVASRKPHYCSLSITSSYSTVGSKISQTPSKPLSLFPFNGLSFAKNLKAQARLNVKKLNSNLQPYDADKYNDSPDELPPFEVIDNISEHSIITLKREFLIETVQVEVLNLDIFEKEVEDSWGQLDIPLVVANSLEFIPLLVKFTRLHRDSMEFFCIASSTDITANRMRVLPCDRVKYIKPFPIHIGPRFSDMDEKLQKAFYNYMEARGIDSSFAKILQGYMIKRDGAEYLASLKGAST